MTARAWLQEACRKLPHCERFDLEYLLAEYAQMTRAHLLAYLDEELSPELEESLRQAVELLQERVPLQYVLKKAYFMGQSFYVNEKVLIPRFDTEYLVEAVLERTEHQPCSVLDLCTGSGIIAISLKINRPTWEVYASDIDLEALEVAKKNAEQLSAEIDFRQGDFLTPWYEKTFDIIVSNPPYISEADYQTLSPEVKNEPIKALVARENGIYFYRILLEQIGQYLNRDGLLAVEIGFDQGKAVMALFEKHGLREVQCIKDGQGLDRVILGRM